MKTDRETRLRIASLCGLSIVLLGGYAIARPAIESQFLAVHGSAALPWVWATVAGVSALSAVSLARLVRVIEVARLFGLVAIASAGLLAALLLLLGAGVPGAAFALYVWKDVYIVATLELFWIFANVVFDEGVARRWYGVFGICGSVGGIVMNLSAGPISRAIGTANVPWLVVPMLLAVAIGAVLLGRHAGTSMPAVAVPPPLRESIRIVSKSRLLPVFLALVLVVQLSITVMEFAFNRGVEQAGLATDARTGLLGQVYAAIDAVTIALHLASPFVLRLGGARVLQLIPVIMLSLLFAHAAVPVLGVLAAVRVASKALDYSLARAGRELLYIPLTLDEKTAGKSLVDVFGYRAAKGLASGVLAVVAVEDIAGARTLALALTVAWLGVTLLLGRRARAASP